MEMDQLYTELILEHNQDKRNKHELAHFTNSEHGHNPSCGDDLTLQLNVEDALSKMLLTLALVVQSVKRLHL